MSSSMGQFYYFSRHQEQLKNLHFENLCTGTVSELVFGTVLEFS